MNIVIVEDEYMVAKRLRRFVENILNNKTIFIQQFDTFDDAQEYLAECVVDVLFLDLNLQGKDGFGLLKQQVSKSFHTIVVSANTERAIEAFDIGIVDFIAKPFSQDRIQKALHRIEDSNQHGHCKYVSYKLLGKLALLPISDILYLKAAGHYCEVVTYAGEVVLHDKSLDKLLLILPETFERIHRSYAAPLKAMQSISSEEGSKYWLTLVNDVILPIGRTRVKALKTKLD